jgi:CDP-4-dehydro-6-deoxyglucose reductase, E1
VVGQPVQKHSKFKVPIAIPTYGDEEIEEVIDSLKSGKVTLGEKVERFESLWAEYLGSNFSLMVNSGSSANLLAHLVLTNPSLPRHFSPGDEIITPAVTWATTVFPIVNIGAKPVFVDVDPETFNVDPGLLEGALSEKTAGVTCVDLLGNPCDMRELQSFVRKNDLIFIEDACNAHGAEYGGKKCGSFGDIGTFSFYFSHIISTIEGGMIVTDDEDYFEIAKSLRVFGWSRGLKTEESIAEKYPQIDKRFLFPHLGYNFRPTEVQGAFGVHQIGRIDDFLRIRAENAKYWLGELKIFEDYFILPKVTPNGKHVWHHFPLTIRPGSPFNRTMLMEFLESRGIETRQISAGNITEQPVFSQLDGRIAGELPNAKLIMRNSFQWGNHQGVGEMERELVIDAISDFIDTIKHKPIHTEKIQKFAQ